MTLETCPKLRIALLLNSFSQPVWVAKIVRDIADSAFGAICLVVKIERADNDSHSPGENGLSVTDLLWKVYAAMDDRSLVSYQDPFEYIHILDGLPDATLVTADVIQKGQRYNMAEHAVNIVRSRSIDVVLDFSNKPFDGSALEMAKFGLWRCAPSGNGQNGNRAPGFWELRTGQVTTEFVLRVMKPDSDQDRPLYQSSTSTDLYSVKGTRSKVYWKSAQAVVRCLRNLHERGPSYLENGNSVQAGSRNDRHANSKPTSRDTVAFLTTIARRTVARALRNWRFRERWFLAYQFGESPIFPDKLGNLKYMEPPKDKFWADPFPITMMGKYYVFLEEFVYSRMKGHISVIEMGQDGKWSPPIKVLDTDYHLSYPYIFEWGGDLYMVPESKCNKTISLYKCTRFPTQWRWEKTLIEDVQAVDSTLFEHDGLWWLFCNIGGKEFSSNDELHLFYADTPLGPWTPHRDNPVKSDVRSSRPAGRLYRSNGEIFRPSQDCSVRMGGAISINRIVELTKEKFREEPIYKIEPTWKKGLFGVHTLNRAGNLTVLDCFDYTRKVPLSSSATQELLVPEQGVRAYPHGR
jgi:hypothetical protein